MILSMQSEDAIVLITHQNGPAVKAMAGQWEECNPHARVRVAYGGSEKDFEKLMVEEKTWVGDERLRTRNHQRERQSYRGLMQAVAADLARGGQPPRHVLMLEYDVCPLRREFMFWLNRKAEVENADVMGVNLKRIDGTNHAHYLSHLADPRFEEWLDFSNRKSRTCVLMMLGCLTWWRWDAFTATAEQAEPFPVYLELAMPTVAHHLGFRVRGLPELAQDVKPDGDRGSCIEARRRDGGWVLHPCKRIWQAQA